MTVSYVLLSQVPPPQITFVPVGESHSILNGDLHDHSQYTTVTIETLYSRAENTYEEGSTIYVNTITSDLETYSAN